MKKSIEDGEKYLGERENIKNPKLMKRLLLSCILFLIPFAGFSQETTDVVYRFNKDIYIITYELPNSGVYIHANLVDKGFNVYIEDFEFQQKSHLTVKSAIGEVIYSRPISQMHTFIHTELLACGMYYVFVERDNYIVHVEKIIIQ